MARLILVILSVVGFCLTKSAWAQLVNNECERSFLDNALKSVRVTKSGKSGLWDKLSENVRQDTITTYEIQKHQYVLHICKWSLPVHKQEYILANIRLVYLEREAFPTLPNSTYVVDLHKNYIDSVRHGVFTNTEIVALNLSHNQIDYIEENAFDNMRHLEILDLDNNQIARWSPNLFHRTDNIRHVYVSNNLLDNLPENVLKNLKCGYLKDSSSTSGMTSFKAMLSYVAHQAFCSISFAQNRIHSVHPKAFGNRTRFGLIDLSGNKIKDVPATWLEDFKMVSINVTNNKLKSLSLEMTGKLKSCMFCAIHMD